MESTRAIELIAGSAPHPIYLRAQVPFDYGAWRASRDGFRGKRGKSTFFSEPLIAQQIVHVVDLLVQQRQLAGQRLNL